MEGVLMLYTLIHILHHITDASACITEGQLRVCPYPIIVYADETTTFEILCNTSSSRGTVISINISKINYEDKELLVSNSLDNNSSEMALRPNQDNPFTQRSVFNGGDTYVKILITSATIDDLICTYECRIRSRLPNSEYYHTERSSIDVRAGAYPGNVSLTISPSQSVYHKEDIFTLLCTATAGLLRQDAGEQSVSDYVFQYFDEGQWTTIDVKQSDGYSNRSYGSPTYKLNLSESIVEGKFVDRNYSLDVKANSIPKGCRRYQCYLTFLGHVFENETSAPVQACSDKEDTLNIPLIVGLSLGGSVLLLIIISSVGYVVYHQRCKNDDRSLSNFAVIISVHQMVRTFASTISSTFSSSHSSQSSTDHDEDHSGGSSDPAERGPEESPPEDH